MEYKQTQIRLIGGSDNKNKQKINYDYRIRLIRDLKILLEGLFTTYAGKEFQFGMTLIKKEDL